MLFGKENPSTVLYDEMKAFGRISNKEVAWVLLSDRVLAGGDSARNKAWNSRTYLSREVANVSPEKVNPTIYANFYGSTKQLYERMLPKLGGAGAETAVYEHFRGPAAQRMMRSLAANGIDATIYDNELGRLAQARLVNEGYRPRLVFSLFCITGSLADPVRAVAVVEDIAKSALSMDLATRSVNADYLGVGEVTPAASTLGLVRQREGVVVPPMYALNPKGTIVGSLADGQGSIANVEVDVSRRHLRIWRDGDGRWLCQGLQSTNGTTLESGADGRTHVVEPRRSARGKGVTYPPKEIHEGDTLCLGANTRFVVLRMGDAGVA